MPAKGANGVGRFSVEFEVANYGDLALVRRGLLPPDQVRRETIRGMVDSGATKLVLPEAVVKRLGLPLGDKVKVRYADGRKPSAERQKGSSSNSWDAMARLLPSSNESERRPSLGRLCSKTSICSWTARAQRVVPRDPSGALFEIE